MAFANLLRDQYGGFIQALAPEASSVVSGAVGASSVRVALPANTDVVRLASTGNCHFEFGDSNVVATSADAVFPVGAEVFKVPFGATHIAVIQNGAATGTFTVSAMR